MLVRHHSFKNQGAKMYPQFWTSYLRSVVFLIIIFSALIALPKFAMSQQPEQTPSPSASPSPTPTPSPTPAELLPVIPANPVTPEDVEKIQKEQEEDVIRTVINLVNITATVSDNDDRLVPGLDKRNFKVYEYDGKNWVEQEIAMFTNTDEPINLGIIFDLSGSMEGNKVQNAKSALRVFLQTCNEKDDVFLVGVTDTPILLQPIITNSRNRLDSILDKLTFVQPKGQTALLDGVSMAIDKLQWMQKDPRFKKQKTALVIISDGQDNKSRDSINKIKNSLRESGIITYTVVIPPSSGRDMDNIAIAGKEMLKELAEVTGGGMYLPDFPMSQRFPEETLSINPRPILSLEAAMEQIAGELRQQYTIAYYPTNKARDGKYRKIKIKVIPPKGYPRLVVRAKPGYYAPKDPDVEPQATKKKK